MAYLRRSKMIDDTLFLVFALCDSQGGKMEGAKWMEIRSDRQKEMSWRVEKDCLISYAGNKYSGPAEYVGKNVAGVGLDNMMAAYFEGKQIALHKISYQKKDMVVNPSHYRRLTVRQTFDIENTCSMAAKLSISRSKRLTSIPTTR